MNDVYTANLLRGQTAERERAAQEAHEANDMAAMIRCNARLAELAEMARRVA